MHRVLVLDGIKEEGLKPLMEADDVELVRLDGLPDADRAAALAGYAAVLVRSATQLESDLLAGAADLRAIGRAGVGVDNIDVAAATARGIPVFNSPWGNIGAAAEHTLALMFALARHIPRAHAALQGGNWDRKSNVGVELAGKTLALVGLGKVGGHVARVAHALGMTVLAYDPFLSAEGFAAAGATQVEDLDELLGQADWVSLHLPRTPATEGLLGRERLAKLKPTARLVNVARGGLVDEEALAEALRERRLAGAAIDVFATEPCTESPLFDLDNVVVTPHLGASTAEAQLKVAVDVAEKVLAFLRDGTAAGAVNEASLSS